MPGETILVVDDEPELRKLFNLQLTRAGYHVLEAGSCDEAYQNFEEHTIDLVLLDIIMPGNSGLECLEYVRKNHPDTKVVMMTGRIPEEIAIQCLDMGADGFLRKPIKRKTLLTCIENLLNGSGNAILGLDNQ